MSVAVNVRQAPQKAAAAGDQDAVLCSCMLNKAMQLSSIEDPAC